MSTILQRACQQGAPLLDRDTATFVWQGAEPPLLRGDWNDWDESRPLAWQRTGAGKRASASTVWTASLTLAPDAYMEYTFGSDDERVADPLNLRVVANGMGHTNHWFYMPAGKPSSWAMRQRGVARGRVTRAVLPTYNLIAGAVRRVDFYQPPTEQPAPLLVVYDGTDYRHRGALPALMDNLLAAGRIEPVALAMVANGRGARMVEYGGSDGTLAFLHEIVLPAAQRVLHIVDIKKSPGAFGVLGASMGGLMAVVTALRLPHIFGRVLSQSGAFHLDTYPTLAIDLVRYMPAAGQRMWLDVGRYEGLLASNRIMHALLQERDYSVVYREYNAGHNYTAWRNDLFHGLQALFPPLAATQPISSIS